MNQQHHFKTGAIAISLRGRAQSLRRQALWMQQAFMEGHRRHVAAEVVFEIRALKEESIELDRLASQYEQSQRPGTPL